MKHSLSLRQAAKRIGIHHVTLSRWVRLGEGPRTFIKPGIRATYRITCSDLEAFMDRHSRGGK